MAEVKLDLVHMQRITAILEALVADGTDLVHAVLACEDAYVLCGVGLTAGLPSVAAVLEQHHAIVECHDDSGAIWCGKIAAGEQCH